MPKREQLALLRKNTIAGLRVRLETKVLREIANAALMGRAYWREFGKTLYPAIVGHITDFLAPFYRSRGHAEQVARQCEAAVAALNVFVMEHDSFAPPVGTIEEASAAAQQVLSDLGNLLEGGDVWSYVPPNPEQFSRRLGVL